MTDLEHKCENDATDRIDLEYRLTREQKGECFVYVVARAGTSGNPGDRKGDKNCVDERIVAVYCVEGLSGKCMN
jgi:hypothetical protein